MTTITLPAALRPSAVFLTRIQRFRLAAPSPQGLALRAKVPALLGRTTPQSHSVPAPTFARGGTGERGHVVRVQHSYPPAHPIARFPAQMRHSHHPDAVGLQFLDDVKGETPGARDQRARWSALPGSGCARNNLTGRPPPSGIRPPDLLAADRRSGPTQGVRRRPAGGRRRVSWSCLRASVITSLAGIPSARNSRISFTRPSISVFQAGSISGVAKSSTLAVSFSANWIRFVAGQFSSFASRVSCAVAMKIASGDAAVYASRLSFQTRAEVAFLECVFRRLSLFEALPGGEHCPEPEQLRISEFVRLYRRDATIIAAAECRSVSRRQPGKGPCAAALGAALRSRCRGQGATREVLFRGILTPSAGRVRGNPGRRSSRNHP